MQKRSKIFIYEDDDGVREVMEVILAGAGYTVSCFDSGKSILNDLAEGKPDLILIDMWLPEIDGETLITQLKGGTDTRALPVIIVSAVSNLDEIAGRCGADYYLQKPFHIEDLLTLVDRVLGQTQYAEKNN